MRTLEQKDFIIGNYYREIEGGRIGKFIKWVSPTKVKMKMSHFIMVCSYEKFESIALSYDILLKAGFINNKFAKDYGFSVGRYDLIIRQITDSYIIMYLRYDDSQIIQLKSISDLDELQNLIRVLLNVELSIPDVYDI